MDSEKSKKILIAVAVVCLAVAAFVALRNLKSESGPPGGVGDMAYKCTKCGHSEMINRDTAMKMARQQGGAPGFGPPALNCPGCGASKAMQFAQNCPACGEIFFLGQAKDPQLPLKCPKCGKTPPPPADITAE